MRHDLLSDTKAELEEMNVKCKCVRCQEIRRQARKQKADDKRAEWMEVFAPFYK